MPGPSGTIRLTKIAGIQVYLHWSWFLVAVYEIQNRSRYASLTWSILEYVSLFAIVTLHEFGHALACRQVGGRAEQIVLWPLGGVAYVNAPPRPGATLWSVAAGPLVNVALIPVLGVALLLNPSTPNSDFRIFLGQLNLINLGLLIFICCQCPRRRPDHEICAVVRHGTREKFDVRGHCGLSRRGRTRASRSFRAIGLVGGPRSFRRNAMRQWLSTSSGFIEIGESATTRGFCMPVLRS